MTSLNPNPQLVDGVDVDAVASAVRACPAVDDLAAGAPASAASYLPGRTVAGIAVGDEQVTIQLRSRWAVPTGEVAAQVRSAVAGLIGPRRVDIVIADIADPSDTEPSSPVRAWSAPPALAPRASGQGPGQAGEVGQWSQPNVQPGAPSSSPTIPTPAAIPPSS